VTRALTLVGTLLLLAASPGAGAEADFRFATLALPNGVWVGFSLLRTGSATSAGALDNDVHGAGRSNAVNRLLWDHETRAYFGYRVEVTRHHPATGFRIAFSSLDPRAAEETLGHASGSGVPTRLAAAAPRFPPPQDLAEGEVLTLELLANPTTGERIYDVIKVSSEQISESAMRAAVERVREGQSAVRRASVHVARGRFAQAAAEFSRALEIQPRDASLHNKLGICYQHLDNVVLARREYDQALRINPGYAEVWNNIGTLEQSRERLKEAVSAYRRAIRIKPELPTPWKNLGNAYLAQEKPEEAYEAYQEAFRLDPTILESEGLGIPAAGIDAATQSFQFAKLAAAHGRVDLAVELLRRARDAGFKDFDRVRTDPDFKTVVADPRFKALFE
jgi:tetratricopeptide (TPR) repeat protein